MTRYEFSGARSSLAWPLLLVGVDRLVGPDERTPFVLNGTSCSVWRVSTASVCRWPAILDAAHVVNLSSADQMARPCPN